MRKTLKSKMKKSSDGNPKIKLEMQGSATGNHVKIKIEEGEEAEVNNGNQSKTSQQ